MSKKHVVFRTLGIVAVSALFIAPLAFMILGSLRSPGLPPPDGFDFVPTPARWSNYQIVFSLVPMWNYARNSLVVVALAVPITVLIASWAGFSIATADSRIRKRLVVISILALMVPVAALWIPRFAIFKTLGLVDTLWPLIAPALMATTPFYVLLFALVYARVPANLFEAARLEGLSTLQVWWRVAFPLGRSATFAVAVLALVFHWSNFTDALLYLYSESNYTLPLGIRALQALEPSLHSIFLAGAVMVTIPPLIAFLMAQRMFFDDVLEVR